MGSLLGAVGFGIVVMVIAAAVLIGRKRYGTQPVIFAAIAASILSLLLFTVYRYWGLFDVIAIAFGLLIGAVTMPAMGTPFFPSPPRMLGIQALFMRIYFTISSMNLGANVLYKKANGAYTRVRASIDDGDITFTVDDEEHTFTGASHRLIRFGMRPLGLAWSKDHPMYQRIKQDAGDREVTTDGGEPAELVDMGKLHRMLRGAANHRAINETVKEARNKHGGGDQGLSQSVLMGAVILMLILGFATGMVAG